MTTGAVGTMNTLKEINSRLRQLDGLEEHMLAECKVLEKRRVHDEKTAKERASEDARWHLEEQARENEEDVSLP